MIRNYRDYLPSIHKEGYIIIFISFAINLLLFSTLPSLGWASCILTIFCVFFFRDPERTTPLGENIVVSPADGILESISTVTPPKELSTIQTSMIRMSVFLNVVDVHVNRVPISGSVKALQYIPGKFLNATLDKSSQFNERQAILIETKSKKEVGVVQIAGLIARRIVCSLRADQEVSTGERFGIIRFGSRVDIYLPEGAKPLVLEGQRMVGGETILADLSNLSVELPRID